MILNNYTQGSIIANNTSGTVIKAQNTDLTKYAQLNTDGSIKATGQIEGDSFNAVSDRRLKSNVTTMGSILDKIQQLNPVEYEWKKNGKRDCGFIAQDYYRVFPDLKPPDLQGEEPTDEEGNPKYYSMDYGKITCFLTKAIQELTEQKGQHGRGTSPENQQDVVMALGSWNDQTVYVVQITPMDGNWCLCSSPVENGRFTVSGASGDFFWSVFPETASV